MKNKLKELDVDFIGGQEPITKEEELSISKFIQASKEKDCRHLVGQKEQLRKKFISLLNKPRTANSTLAKVAENSSRTVILY